MIRRHSLVLLSAAAVIVAALPVQAANGRALHVRYSQTIPLNADGTLFVDNPAGVVNIVGSESAGLQIVAERIVTAVDDDAAREGRDRSAITIGGDESKRVLRSLVPAPNSRYSVIVNYKLRVPRTVHVHLSNGSTPKSRIWNISGNVFVKNGRGEVEVANVTGPITAESINGSVRVYYGAQPQAHAKLSTVNGTIQVTLPPNTSVEWTAETLKGEIFSNVVDLRGNASEQNGGRVYRGVANRRSNAKIHTTSVTGPTYLLTQGSVADARPLSGRAGVPGVSVARSTPLTNEMQPVLQRIQKTLMQAPAARTFVLQRSVIDGDLTFETNVGNVFIGDMLGDAKIATKGGEIILGRVSGRCLLRSEGGPINLGDINGPIDAQTGAGDIMVGSARNGGVVATKGGNVQVGYAGGSMGIISGGGDISVRRAAASVEADTRSGDITISMDPTVGQLETIVARTGRGNIVLNLNSRLRADIDATIETSADASNSVQSAFKGLSITRDQVGDRVRIRATGKINGGGARIELRAQNGNIHLRSVEPQLTASRNR